MESIDEHPMARDFFRSTPRDVSPSYRWARRSRSRSRAAAPDKEQDARCLHETREKVSPHILRSAAPSPLTLPLVRSKGLVLNVAAPRTTAADLGSSSLKTAPVRKLGGDADGADSPTGPLEFPASPSSSAGSFKETASPVPKLGPTQSKRRPSPNRGPPRQGTSLFPDSPETARKSWGAMRAGAQSSSPLAVHKQAKAPAMVSVPGLPAEEREAMNILQKGGAIEQSGTKVELGAGGGLKGGKAAARHTTPFRRGLEAIKGRLFSESRKSSEVAAAEEIHKTQQSLAASHKVKPAASPGIKSMLVSRLTRLGRSSRSLAPPPLAIQEAPTVLRPQPAPQTSLPAPGSLLPPRHLALDSPVILEEKMQAEEGGPIEEAADESSVGMRAGSRQDEQIECNDNDAAESDASSGAVMAEGEEASGEKEVRWVEEEDGESRVEGGDEEANSYVVTPAAMVQQAFVGSVGKKLSKSMPQRIDFDSDSDQETNILKSLSRLSFHEAASPSPRASWAQRVPLTSSPAASWDSQSSLEFANSHRPSLAQRFFSSESSSSEQGSPRRLEKPRASPLGVTPEMARSSPMACEDTEAAIGSASPAAPTPLSPRPGAALAPRRLDSSLLWSSDEEEEIEAEDRSCRKRDMANALHELRAFQAGGRATPRRVTAPLQRSLTDPSAIAFVKRTASPMRTLWRQASAAVGGEGSTPSSSATRMGPAAAGRALSSRSLSRSRDRSPCPSGLLASPRPLLAEPSPLLARPGAFDDGPCAGAPRGAEARLGRTSFTTARTTPAGGTQGRFAKTPGRSRPIAAAAAFFRSMTPGRQRSQVM